MNFLDFLYFAFYCLVIKKENETGEERASFLLSGSTSTLIVASYFLASIVKGDNLVDPIILFFAGTLVYVLNGWLTSRYFVRSGRFQVIIERFSRKTNIEKKVYAIIGLIFFIGSFVLFGLAGYNFSRIVFG